MSFEESARLVGAAADRELVGVRAELRSALDAATQADMELSEARAVLTELQAEIGRQQDIISQLRRDLADCHKPPAGFGVNVHTNYRQSQYANDAECLGAVQRLGATRIRTFLATATWWDQAAVLGAYRDAGIKVHLTVGNFARSKDADKPKLLEALLAVVDCVDSVAGFNEPDAGGLTRSQWLPRAAAWHNWLWGAVKGHPDLKHLLVLPGALQGKDDSPDDTAAYAAALDGFDRWNAHWYPGNVPSVENAYEARKATWPGPTWITEFGGNVSNVSQATASRNLTEVLRLHTGDGEAAFIYELLGADEFGMFDAAWQPTPSGRAVIEAA